MLRMVHFRTVLIAAVLLAGTQAVLSSNQPPSLTDNQSTHRVRKCLTQMGKNRQMIPKLLQMSNTA